jgi:hypothetical protein
VYSPTASKLFALVIRFMPSRPVTGREAKPQSRISRKNSW